MSPSFSPACCTAPASLFDEKQFDGDENAIVDFKYSSSPRITWWFDHHLSAFLTPEDAAHFEQDQSNRKFYDPDFKSCTSFIATIAQQRFGFDPSPVADLVHWTDIVDGAMYPDARTAVEMQAPAMKLTLIIESAQNYSFIPQLIPSAGHPASGRNPGRALRGATAAAVAGAAPALDRGPERTN